MASNKLKNEGVSFAGRCLNSFAVLMASISAFLIMPQIANADPSQGHYPILTVADIEVCRPKLSDFQSDWLQHLRVNLGNSLPNGKFPDAAAASNWKGMLDKDAIDPVLFYAQGLDNGEALIGNLAGINEYGEFREEAYRNILKGLDSMGGPRLSNSANFNIEYNDFRYENYYAAETCIAQVWTAKFNAMHPDATVASNANATQQSQPFRATDAPSVSAQAGVPSQSTVDARAAGATGNHSVAIQHYSEALAADPGNSALRVERGIQYQLQGQMQPAIADFTDVIARDPGYASAYYYRATLYQQLGQNAQAYADAEQALRLAPDDKGVQARAQQLGVSIATNAAPASNGVGSYASGGGYAPGGMSVSGPDKTGENTVASPKIVETTLPAKPVTGTGGSALPSQQKTGDFTPVSDCVSIEQSSHHPFTNKCGFKVTYTYCVLSPKKDAWSEAFKCEDQKFGTDEIGANNINGAQNGGGVTTYWFACRYPQLPIAKYERGRGAVGVCK